MPVFKSIASMDPKVEYYCYHEKVKFKNQMAHKVILKVKLLLSLKCCIQRVHYENNFSESWIIYSEKRKKENVGLVPH